MGKELYYGIGQRNINPQMPISLAGYFNVRMWRKVLDDIEVRVLVLKQLAQYCAIAQFDLVTVSQELADAFYKEISDIKELSFRNMIVTATHSHTAPEVRTTNSGFHPDYIPFAVKKASEALREALGGMVRGEVSGGLAKDKRFSFNRRYWMKDGTVVTNPGKLNPEIDRPEGEVDHEIPLIGIKSNGKLKVLMANIVNHTDTIGGSDVSADWPGFFMRRIQSDFGGGLMVLPLIGTSGNINHFDVSTNMNQTCYAEAERIGCGYADSVEKALHKLQPLKDFTLFTRQAEVVCGPREIPEDELAEAKLILEKYKDIPDLGPGADLTSEDLARKEPKVLKYFARKLLDLCNDHEPRKFNLVGIFLGNFCIISLPCEPFVEIGLEIKKKIFTHYNTIVVSHSNGTGHPHVGGGYIPNSFNYGRGGYETTPGANRFSAKTADQLIDAWRKIAPTVH